MQFAMASSLVARAVGLSQLTDEFVGNREVQSLIPRVSTATTTETMDGSAFAPSESVEISTVNGEVFASEPIVLAKGSMQRPLSRDELQDKFIDCLGDDLAAKAKADAFEKLMSLERLNGAADLLVASVRPRHAEHVLAEIGEDQVGRDRRDLIEPRLAPFALDVVFLREAEAAVASASPPRRRARSPRRRAAWPCWRRRRSPCRRRTAPRRGGTSCRRLRISA